MTARETLPPASGSSNGGRASARSLADHAYELIKQDIITLRLRPGEYLNEAQLIETTGIGRTPVHQALHRLELDGMLRIMPRKGVMVTPVSLNDVLDIIEVRRVNEALCAELAARHAGPDDLATLQGILDRSQDCIARHDVRGMMELDREFHLALSRASRNHVLAELLRGLHERSLRFWFLSLSEPSHLEGVYGEHLEIFAALKARDAKAAKAAIQRHIEEFRTHILKAI